ncbi:MAG: hypothetical protein JO112_01485, partial [Planctomycetes bacterium]|nr:hypothetical protein [Planctomycetota bacterium]
MATTLLTCPSCDTTLKTASPLPPGKRVKCPKCGLPFTVPAGETPGETRVPSSTRLHDGRRETAAPRQKSPPREIVADEDESDRPVRRRSATPRRKKGSPILIGSVVAVVLIVGAAVALVASGVFNKKPADNLASRTAPASQPAAPQTTPPTAPSTTPATEQPAGSTTSSPSPVVSGPKAISPGEPSAGSTAAVPASSTTDPPVADGDTLPRKAQVGTTFTYQLSTAKGQATYNLITGPTGAQVSREGLLHWTPLQGMTGPQQLIVQVNNNAIERYKIQVEEPATTQAAAGTGAGTETAPPDPLLPNNSDLPRTLKVGEPFTYRLPPLSGQGGTMYMRLSGPAGLDLTPQGLIRWTPKEDQAGKQLLVFTRNTGGSMEVYRYNLTVAGTAAPAVAASPVGPTPAVPANPIRPTPGVVSTPAPASPAPAEAGVAFEVLAADAPVTAMDVSEDGLFLFTAHQKENRVTVWDVKTAKLVKSLEAPAPRSLLHRAGKLFVGSDSQPAIRVFSQADGWGLGDELKVGSPKIHHLTAPQGTAFAGQIIADCGQYNQNASYVVDVSKDQARTIPNAAVTSADPVGRYALLHDDFSAGYFGRKVAVDYPDLIAGVRTELEESGEERFLFAGPWEQYWFGAGEVWQGIPPQPQVKVADATAVPDL